MEFEIPALEHKGITLVTSADQIDNQANFYSPVANHNGIHYQHESMDSDVAKEIQYLDEVLEANCCDSTAENTFNGTYSPQPSTADVGGAVHSVTVENDHAFDQKKIILVDRKQPPVVEQSSPSVLAEQLKPNGHSPCEQREYNQCDTFSYPGSPSSSNSSRRSSKDGEITLTTIKKEAKFELRAFHEDKKPAKLFDDIDEKDKIRVRKVRPSEEVIELEKERKELIRSQAVKKNPGIAAKWWNPPQEKTLEEQLDEEHLESHKKYKERKQKQQGSTTPPKPKTVSFVPPEPVPIKKEDIVTEQIDFSAARKQFLNMENTSQVNNPVPSRRSVTPKLFTVKPFYKSLSPTQPKKPTVSVTGPTPATESTQIVQSEEEEVTSAKASKVSFAPEEHLDNRNSPEEQLKEPAFYGSPKDELPANSWHGESDFLRATAVLTVVKDDDQDMADHLFSSASISSPPDESDSGLDELSVKSQDTTVLESLSNDFSMDNISDSGASNETMNTLQENSMGDFSQPQTPQIDTPSEYRLDGMSKSFSDQGFYSPSSTLLDSMLLDDQLQYHAGLLVQSAIQQALAEQAERDGLIKDLEENEIFGEQEQSTEQHVESSVPSSPASECQDRPVFEQQQSPSPVQKPSDAPSKPKTLSFQDFELREEKSLPHSPVSSFGPQVSVEENRQEGGYFSKYSQSAELRSTAELQEPEVTVGPFKLRSRKQRTLSMIEEEIRAAQEREEELKKQRQRLQNPPSPVSKTAPTLPTRTALYKTAPGKIEKIRSPSSPTSDSYPPELDLLSEDAAGNQKPKNLMETLLEDFESHKTKRRERTDDSSVIEATRVSRRKSALALRWEAGIYANREEDE